MLRSLVLFSTLVLFFNGCAGDKKEMSQIKESIKTQDFEYNLDGKDYLGYFAVDSEVKGKRPGILVIHEWWGLNDYPKMRARQLAELGYVAFAMDVYGKGIVTNDHNEAGKLSGANGDSKSFLKKSIML